MTSERPDRSDYHEYYARYVGLVPDGDILETLGAQMTETQALLAAVPPDREEFRYAPGKWSLREVIGHLIDVERAFASRCHWMARGFEGDLPGFEQDEWAERSNAGARALAELAEEWAVLRRDNLVMFSGFDAVGWGRRGRASGYRFRTLAFPWIIAGHELYHRALLRRDYLDDPE